MMGHPFFLNSLGSKVTKLTCCIRSSLIISHPSPITHVSVPLLQMMKLSLPLMARPANQSSYLRYAWTVIVLSAHLQDRHFLEVCMTLMVCTNSSILSSNASISLLLPEWEVLSSLSCAVVLNVCFSAGWLYWQGMASLSFISSPVLFLPWWLLEHLVLLLLPWLMALVMRSLSLMNFISASGMTCWRILQAHG